MPAPNNTQPTATTVSAVTRPFLVLNNCHQRRLKMLLKVIILFLIPFSIHLVSACVVHQDCFPQLGPNSSCIGARCVCDHQAGFYISQVSFTCENYFLEPKRSSFLNIALPESPVIWFLFFLTLFTIIAIIFVCAIRRQKAVRKRAIAQRFF